MIEPGDVVGTAWLEVCSGLALTPVEDVVADLRRRYGEAHRRYHTLRHVEACLEVFGRHRAEAERSAEVMAAILFHDAVYDPSRVDNERLSAELARDVLVRSRAAPEATERIAAMILATARHPRDATGDVALLLDVDLSIFGEDAVTFDAYDHAIREEYGFVPADAYGPARRDVLAGFLERRQIYLTDGLRFERESAARANLQRALAALDATCAERRHGEPDGALLARRLAPALEGTTLAVAACDDFVGLAGEARLVLLRVEPGPPEALFRGLVARDQIARVVAALERHAQVLPGQLHPDGEAWSHAWSVPPAPGLVVDRRGVVASALARQPARIGDRELDPASVARVEAGLSADWIVRTVSLVIVGGERVVLAQAKDDGPAIDPTYDALDLDHDAAWAPALARALGRALGVEVRIDPAYGEWPAP
jgi:predicted metal-dependent HD superfamily phosphohydrolase